MRKDILNGTPIPYDLSIEDLNTLISSSDMVDFSLACEALSYKNETEAYQILKSHMNDKDKYRRLYVLKTIFRHPQAVELVDFLESAIASDDFLFVENGLMLISDYQLPISEFVLMSAMKNHCDRLQYTALYALKMLHKSDSNFKQITEIFALCPQCGQKEILGEILCDVYLPEKACELFALFSDDLFGSIRLIGLKIGKQYGFDVSKFLLDVDGHVRKAAK